MTRLEDFKQLVRSWGHRFFLGDILRTPHAAEYRKMATLLRNEGWLVHVSLNRKSPAMNLYTFVEPTNGKI
jgi:hypothetical protein